MRLLLLQDVRKLGHLGDIVEVSSGYARNYLVPQRLATEPTDENIQALEQTKKAAAGARARRLKEYQALADSIRDVSVSVEAAANPEGTLYGSVGPADVAEALQALGHPVLAEQVVRDPPVRTLDNRTVRLEFTEEVTTEIKLWVVRAGTPEHADETSESVETVGEFTETEDD